MPMHRLLSLLWFSAIGMMTVSSGLGQDCAKIRRDAEIAKMEKRKALEVHLDLAQTFAEKEQIAESYRLTLPPSVVEALTSLDPSAPMYRNERGKCSDDGIRWGTVKDLREYKRDSIEHLNTQLIRRIARLQNLIEDYENGLPATATPQPIAPEPQGRPSPFGTLEDAGQDIFRDRTFLYCIIDPERADLRISDRRDYAGLYDFQTLETRARKEGKDLVFAMNGGMFHPDKQAVGLLVQEGQRLSPLNLRKGSGNFYMQPNGVFFVDKNGRARLLPSKVFASEVKSGKINLASLQVATQSGPMMMFNRRRNAKFNENSPNRHFRNAVGVMEDGRVMFVLSQQRVTFFELTDFMKKWGCKDALYLDGVVSRMYLPAANQLSDLYDSDHLGPVLYIVE